MINIVRVKASVGPNYYRVFIGKAFVGVIKPNHNVKFNQMPWIANSQLIDDFKAPDLSTAKTEFLKRLKAWLDLAELEMKDDG